MKITLPKDSAPLPIPDSFPNASETLFLKLLLCKDVDFPVLWQEWKSSAVFEDIDFATLRIVPALYLRIKDLGFEDELVGKIKGAYRMAWVKNQRTIHAAANAIRILTDESIPVMILKGLPLLIDSYGDTGARFTGDADLLVRPADVKRSIELLLKNGWSYVDAAFARSHESGTDGIMSVTKETNFQDTLKNEIDLHWGLFHSTNRKGFFDLMFGASDHVISFDDLEPASLPVSFIGVSCLMPSHEDTLIHVVAHGSARNDHRAIRWIADAAAIIRNSGVDWDTVLTRTVALGFTVEMQVALPYIKETYGIEIPDDFLRELSALPASQSDIKRYYKNANGIPYTWLGAFPLLWRSYWHPNPVGSFAKRWLGFGDYLAASFGLSRKRELVSFVLGKYKERVKYFLKKSGKK